MSLRVALCYRCDDRQANDLYARLVPGGLLCLHGVLRRAGFESRLFNFSGLPWPQVEAQLARFAPRLVGVSHFTHNHAASMRLYRRARAAVPNALILAGGEQVTYLDVPILRLAPELDGIVRGEGETPLLDVARRLAAGRDWQGALGLSLRSGDTVQRRPLPPPIAELDDSYTLERFEDCEGVLPEEQFPFLITSRGCPGRCTFCDTPTFWGNRLRVRSIASVVAEVRHLMRTHGLMYFGFRDDTLVARRDRVRALCAALTAETPGLLWSCQSRVDTLDAETLLAMKQAGCEQIQLGVESLAPDAQELLGKHVRRDALRRLLAECRSVGIRTSAYLITGIPGQTTLSLAAERALFTHDGLQDAIVSPLCYYPGTTLFARARETGAVSENLFLAGRARDLYVRQDRAASQVYRELCRFIETHAAANAFTADEIQGQLDRTGRCASALLDWGRLCLTQRRLDEAQGAFREIRERWPRHPWGYQGLADHAVARGHEREATRWQRAADRAARAAGDSGAPAGEGRC